MKNFLSKSLQEYKRFNLYLNGVVLGVIAYAVIGLYSQVLAITYGSDTVVSRQGNVTFPAGDTNNFMLGFAAFVNGVNFQGPTTTCLFNDFFPVTGSITLNGGTLTLAQDLTFLDGTLLNGSGFFDAQFNSITFDILSTISLPPSGSSSGLVFNNAQLTFNCPVYVNESLTFSGSSILDLKNNFFTLGPSGSIIVGKASSLLIRNAVLQNVSGTDLTCIDNTCTLALDGVQIVAGGDILFDKGTLAIAGDTVMTGSSKFIYSSPQTCTISAKATWMFDSGMTFSYCPGANNLLKFEDATSTLYLYETLLYVPSPGLQLTKGALVIEGVCPFFNDATLAANGIWIGDGTAGNDMELNVLPDSGIYTSNGYVVYKNLA